MFFTKGHRAKWFWQSAFIGGIYVDDETLTFVIMSSKGGNPQLLATFHLSMRTSEPENKTEIEEEFEAFANRIGGLQRVSFYVVSAQFQVIPLVLPSEIDEYEAIACAQLKLKQQQNSDDWLWDVELDRQNSKLWLLSKAQFNKLFAHLARLNIQKRSVRSWQPLAAMQDKRAEAERFFIRNAVDNPEKNQRELVLATAAALFGLGV
ncbi:hypothetical protein CWE13_09075 [Aliidiomarina shirensis]|uniref:Uncharacterized protein n=1 Tax=Aliidiomarina shirensis TaxID=1048642 RepID=A0A432WTA7_9GAMM|nr:hypothetical protein [Aliidiomarina shirensis]RUO36984.1 hypothetical protein CWE13_09075 [Aliidiomarina shirensis]